MEPDESSSKEPATASQDSVQEQGQSSATANSQPQDSHPGQAVQPATDEDDYLATIDRISLVSWGTGSGPALPSVGDEESSMNDGDSAIGSYRSSTMSLRSSIYDYVEENGRTYHRYKEGKYLLPNDELEQERLDLQHVLFLLTTHGKLFLAPLGDNIRDVLDFATGTGIWAIEFARDFPKAVVLGTDLSPIQPLYVPPNCHFEVDDAEDEWAFSTKFDYIHGRALLTCFKDPRQVFKSAFDALAPGGWLELQDFWIPMEYMGDGKPTDSALYKWNQYCLEGSYNLGRPWIHPPNYKQYLEEIGFVDVVERRFYWPLGTWASSKYYKTVGKCMQEVLLSGLEGISLRVMAAKGWSIEETRVFLAQVRNDIKDPSLHAYMNAVFVYGRRPEAA